jgi:hypothetical protein
MNFFFIYLLIYLINSGIIDDDIKINKRMDFSLI